MATKIGVHNYNYGDKYGKQENPRQVQFYRNGSLANTIEARVVMWDNKGTEKLISTVPGEKISVETRSIRFAGEVFLEEKSLSQISLEEQNSIMEPLSHRTITIKNNDFIFEPNEVPERIKITYFL